MIRLMMASTQWLATSIDPGGWSGEAIEMIFVHGCADSRLLPALGLLSRWFPSTSPAFPRLVVTTPVRGAPPRMHTPGRKAHPTARGRETIG